MPRARSLLRGDRTDAPQRVDRQLLQERLDALGAITVRPSGFFQPDAILARNLFGATPADAVRPRRFADARLQPLARRSSPSGSPQAFSVTSRYASSSDSGSTSGVTSRKIENTAFDAARYFVKVRPDDDERRAEPDGPRHRHRRVHAERARLVARGGDDAASGRAGRRRRRACRERRVVALLDRRVERVHVDVENAAHRDYNTGLRTLNAEIAAIAIDASDSP